MANKIEIEIDRDIFEAINAAAQAQPARVNKEFQIAIRQLQNNTLQKLQDEPGKPKYPIRWTSERQRRAFFATKGFGRGIPTVRSHALVKGWRAEFDATNDGGLFSFINRVNYEQFVTGIYQQGFHNDTGWYQSQNILVDALVEAEDTLIDVWARVMELK